MPVAGRNMEAGVLADQQQRAAAAGTVHRERRFDGAQGVSLRGAWTTSHGEYAVLDDVMSVTDTKENYRCVMICTEVGALSTGNDDAPYKQSHTPADLLQERA